MKSILLVFLILFCMPIITYGANKAIICNYYSYSDENGNHKLKEKLVLTFIIDKIKGVAYVKGRNGKDRIRVIPSGVGGSMSFIEITGAGNVITTAIGSDGESVHSRNIIINGKITPTQCYGECEFR
ncbi:MAG: hypothetical protein P8X90_35940 [Desulfobacterales bacterium]